jgi:hypothetical protein
MVMYKGKYCMVRQYMPKKLVRFGIKVWAATDAISKYLWNFKVLMELQSVLWKAWKSL